MEAWWVWQVGVTGEGKERGRGDAGDIAAESRRRHSPASATCQKAYAATDASAALSLLDDARWYRRRGGALHLPPWRRYQSRHTSTTASWE